MSFRKKKVESALDSLFSTSKRDIPQAIPAEKEKRASRPPRSKTSTSKAAETDQAVNHIEVVQAEAAVESKPEKQTQAAADPFPPEEVAEATREILFPILEAEEFIPTQAAGEELIQTTPALGSTPVANAAVSHPQAPQVKSEEITKKFNDYQQLVLFTLENELFGISIAGVESIIKTQSITVVPRARSYVVGVTNLRGTVLPVIDLRRRFGLSPGVDSQEQRIVVVLIQGEKIGLMVDSVTEVLRIPTDSIEPPPPMVTAINTAFISGIAKTEDKLIILLNLEQVLASGEGGEQKSSFH